MKKAEIRIKADVPGEPLGDLFGIFFEDLNHAADGGLYAEMVQNRSFEFDPIDHPSYHSLTGWKQVGDASLDVRTGDSVSIKNPHYLHIEAHAEKSGVRNMGFEDGMFLEEGKKYDFSCYARGKALRVALTDENGEILDGADVQLTAEWNFYSCVLSPKKTVHVGSLELTAETYADLDLVSLFPEDIYRGRKNGLRKDLAEALEDLHPRFMRFPGGCLVHDGKLEADARDSLYRWKNTIGDVKDRPARRNNWRYNQTLGLGYYEYFLLCEDIQAKPVPILPAAYDPHHQRMAPLDQLDEWIQETLDLIEFANGDTSTKWGGIRASLGHPAPFHLEYLGVGNEEVGEGFRERFPYFVRAIKEKAPYIKIIGSSGPFCGGREYELGWECARENGADIVDEHFYMPPKWFLANMHRYDSFSEKAPHVFLGEYATMANGGENALTEAAFMTQLQNNAASVKMACYAPLFCNKNYVNWKPDMIWFDNERVCRSVNYEVQKLFMNHQGDELLPVTMTGEKKKPLLRTLEERKSGGIWFWGDESRMAFSKITLQNLDTMQSTEFPDLEVQTDGKAVCLTENGPQNFTLTFCAKELEGYKGFRLFFGAKDEKNRLGWVLGGWENQDGALVEDIDGKCGFLTQNRFQVEKNREYHLTLKVIGNRIEGWIDGELFQSTELAPEEVEPLYVTASLEKESGDVILKAVNLQEEPVLADVLLDGRDQSNEMEIWTLLESSCKEDPDFPGVETAEVTHEKTEKGTLTFPARSVTVLRL